MRGCAARTVDCMVDRLDSLALPASGSLTDACLQCGEAGHDASTIPGVNQVSITFIDTGDRTRTVVFSGSLAATLDERQYETGFGPGLAAAQTGGVVRVDDTAADASYPDFAAIARRAGVSGALGMGLPMPAGALAAMVLYRTSGGGPVSSEAETVAALFGAAASAPLANAAVIDGLRRRVAQLDNAMLSREVIEQAKGIVMHLGRCDADTAFRLLAKQSQRANRKLRDVAAEIVAGSVRGTPADMPLLLNDVTRLT